MLICVCLCILVGCMWTHVFFLSWQRITEQAGVVLSLDPKPIEVANSNCYILFILEINRLNGLLWSIFIGRVTGMELDATPITGNWMHSLSLSMIVEETMECLYCCRNNDGSVLLQYKEHERGRRLWSHKEGNSESVSSPQRSYQCLWRRKWEKVDRKARNSKYQHVFLGTYEDLLDMFVLNNEIWSMFENSIENSNCREWLTVAVQSVWDVTLRSKAKVCISSLQEKNVIEYTVIPFRPVSQWRL